MLSDTAFVSAKSAVDHLLAHAQSGRETAFFALEHHAAGCSAMNRFAAATA
jgi:hypothetical protein